MKLSTAYRLHVLAVSPAFPFAGYVAVREQSAWLTLLLFVGAFFCGRLWQVAAEMALFERDE